MARQIEWDRLQTPEIRACGTKVPNLHKAASFTSSFLRRGFQ